MSIYTLMFFYIRFKQERTSANHAAVHFVKPFVDRRSMVIIVVGNPVANRDQELKINTLQNAPRDLAALQTLIFRKEQQKDQAQSMIETDQLCTEIEMLQVVRSLLFSSRAAKRLVINERALPAKERD